MSKILSFRGLLEDGGQDTINLETIRGVKGYKIVKLQIMSQEPYAAGSGEHLVQVWSQKQTTINGEVDFSNQTLLGSAIINNSTAGYAQASIPVIIFDNTIFNQDIFVTQHDGQDALACNYHIELEQMDLNMDEATVATLKNIRNTQ